MQKSKGGGDSSRGTAFIRVRGPLRKFWGEEKRRVSRGNGVLFHDKNKKVTLRSDESSEKKKRASHHRRRNTMGISSWK